MVAAVTAYDSQTVFNIVSESSPLVTVPQLGSLVVYSVPSPTGNVSQAQFITVNETSAAAYASQVQAIVLYRGRVDNHKIRVWSFSLDGHDFYVVTLGETVTLVYDLTTDSWAEWSTTGYEVWRAHRGINWITMGADTFDDAGAQSNVVAGDNAYGLLWTLNPEVGHDENPETGEVELFNRKVIGGVQQKLRETHPIGGAYVLASAGTPELTGANITLRTSDDMGNTWDSHGTVTVEINNFSQEFAWRSLGLIRAPGKLFEITDTGAVVRIDSLDIR